MCQPYFKNKSNYFIFNSKNLKKPLIYFSKRNIKRIIVIHTNKAIVSPAKHAIVSPTRTWLYFAEIVWVW